MGTRSLTYVYNENNGIVTPEPIMCMYRQFDGYPSGHGSELAEFLMSGKIVNGISMNERGRVFNGMPCLAAQLVANFKKEAGGIYLHSPVLGQNCWQEYEYHVWEDKVKVTDTVTTLFEGTWEAFSRYCNQEEFELTSESVEVLKKELHEGIVEVTFEKNDGSTRVMKCTLQEDKLPKVEASVKTKRHNPDVLAVWDTEADGWRSFRYDSILKVRTL